MKNFAKDSFTQPTHIGTKIRWLKASLLFLTIFIYTSTTGQTIYNGYKTILGNGIYTEFRFKKENQKTGNSFETTYFLFDERGRNFLIVKAVNDKDLNIVRVNLKGTSGGLFDRDDKYEFQYDDCDGYLVVNAGVYGWLAGKDFMEALLFFDSSKRNFISINQIMDRDTDRYHYEFEKIPKNILTLHSHLVKKCEEQEEERELKEKQEQEKQQALALERKRKEEEQRLRNFLDKRKSTIYEYQILAPEKFDLVYLELSSKLKDILLVSDDFSETEIRINFQIDTLGNVIKTTDFSNTYIDELKASIEKAIGQINISPVEVNGYQVNAKGQITFEALKKKSSLSLKYFDQKLIVEKVNLSNETIAYLNSEFIKNLHPDGFYKVDYSELVINGNNYRGYEVRDFKELGGSAFGLLSVLVPGSGDHFVKYKGSMFGNNISPWVTTVGTLGIIGTGVLLKISSNNNYDSYQSATNQSDIDKYYELANDQNKIGWAAIGIGTAIWIGDVIWVMKQGQNNRYDAKIFKQRLDLALTPSNNSLGLALNLKF